jgi:Secretion system C-terminal sorting domain/HmuY protein
MIKNFTTIAIIACASIAANAQTWVKDSLVMGTGQTNDVYYHLGTGLVKAESNTNWAMALGNLGGQKAGVYTNTRAGILCYNSHKPVSDWATVTLADTANSVQQYNQDTCWYTGALNANADGSSFDYGWGSYAGAPTHNVVGDTIYFIKQGANFLKFRIDSLGGFTKNWTVTIGSLGLPIPDQTLTFSPGTKYVNRNFIYLNIVQAPPPTYFAIVDTNREPANNTWDFVATKYRKLLITPPMAQNYTGILNNGKIKSVQINSVPVDIAAANFTTAGYTKTINNIGADWKFFNGTSYEMDDTTNSYLVQSNDSAYYQIRFRADAYAIGTSLIRFEKRKLSAPTAISQINNSATSFGVYPNPSASDVMISVESKENADAQLSLTDMQGKIIFTKSIAIAKGLNAYTLPTAKFATGNYIIGVNGKNIKASQLFVKQ